MDLMITSNSKTGEMIEDDDSEEFRTLWVGNMQEKVDKEVLYELFMNSGPVLKVTIPRNKQTKKPKSFAFVLFEHKESVQYAIQQMAGVVLYGQKLVMKPSFSSGQSFGDVPEQVLITPTLFEVNQNVWRNPFELEGNHSMNMSIKFTENQNYLRNRFDSRPITNIKVAPWMDVTPAGGSVLQKQDPVETNQGWILSSQERNTLNGKDDHREQTREWNRRRERSQQTNGDGINRFNPKNRSNEEYPRENSKSRSHRREREDTHNGDRSRSRRRYDGSSHQDDGNHEMYSRERSRLRREAKEREDRNQYRQRRSPSRSKYRGERKRDRSYSKSRQRESRGQKRKYVNDNRELEEGEIQN